jgi:hypothetical protein
MEKCQVESFYKNAYYLGRMLETNRQGIITWNHYSRSYCIAKKEVYLGKVIEVEILKEGKNGMLRLSRVRAIKERKKERVRFHRDYLKANGFKDLFVDRVYGRRVYRDLSKLIPFAKNLPVSNALVVGNDKDHVYLELEDLDILGIMPINYINWHRIKDTRTIRSYVGETLDVRLVGYGEVNLLNPAGGFHRIKEAFICSSALNFLPDYNKLGSCVGNEVFATVVGSNSTGSILRYDGVPIDLYLKETKIIGEQIGCRLNFLDAERNVIEVESLRERGNMLYGG